MLITNFSDALHEELYRFIDEIDLLEILYSSWCPKQLKNLF